MKLYKICLLSDDFFNDYSHTKFIEILSKNDRPHLVFLIKIENNFFAIPFRTNINHNFGFIFSKSNRNTKFKTGLDYTKAIIINKKSYIGKDADIDDLEFAELKNNIDKIKRDFKKYVNGYCLNPNRDKLKRYKYSTLKYFHKELNIKKRNTPNL